MKHNTKSKSESSQSEASHPGPGQPPDLSWPRSLATPGGLLSSCPCPSGLSGQDVSDLGLLQDQGQLVMVEEVDH